MNSSGTAIFIEPHGTLLESLQERKAWLEQTMPGQAFCGHPPHCTVLFGSYGPSARWLEPLRQRLVKLSDFGLDTGAWQQFPHHALAGGGDPLALPGRLGPALFGLAADVGGCPPALPNPRRKTPPF